MGLEKNIKSNGQVFTPKYIVNEMLDLCGYKHGKKILRKHIMDNSCGDGAILCEIVDRYCNAYLAFNENLLWLKNELETYIHGIDNDPKAIEYCITNLNNICAKYGIYNIKWDLLVDDTLTNEQFNKQMDYVICNPPYVRVHNLNESYEKVKEYEFTKTGMVDLYIAFFEIGVNMLNKYGKLCYITPNSWTTSKAGSEMRNWFKKEKILRGIIDMEHFNVFENYSVYTMITFLDKKHSKDTFLYYNFNEDNKKKVFIDELNVNDIDINGEFYFANKEELNILKEVKTKTYKKNVIVKNGIATLLDKVFINNELPFDEYTTKMLKASTGTWVKCFFPYDINGEPINPEEIYNNKNIIDYLIQFKDELLKRKSDSTILDWFYYGRSQGLKDTNKIRLGINTIIKDVDSIKFNVIPIGCSVYSGLYIYSDKYDLETIQNTIKTEKFVKYIKSLRKYKSGGFYTFSSKDIEAYINFFLNQNE